MAKQKTKIRPATSGRTILDIPIEQILLDPHQPRTEFVPEKIAELALSIKTGGLQQFPVLNLAFMKDGLQFYYIKAGERRYHAHKLLKRTTMTCVVLLNEVYKGEQTVDRVLSQAAENSSREAHTHNEIIRVFELVLEAEKAKALARKGSEHGAIAMAKKRMSETFGKSEGWATNYYTMLSLDSSLRSQLDKEGDERLSFSIGLSLSRAPAANQQSLSEQAEGIRKRLGPKAANSFIVKQANVLRLAHAEATGERVRVRSLYNETEILCNLIRRVHGLSNQLVADEHSSEFAARLERIIGRLDVVDVDELLGQIKFFLVTFEQVKAVLDVRREVVYRPLSIRAA